MENTNKILEEFRGTIYGADDALFDREGNNVSRQVENFILKALEKQKSEILKEIEEMPYEKAFDLKSDEWKTGKDWAVNIIKNKLLEVLNKK
jgi:AAA+ ATPase superfamily predicted ATPase